VSDFSALLVADKAQAARSIHLVDPKGYEDWLKSQPERHRVAIAAQGLKPVGYANAILPGEKADEWSVVTIVANIVSLSPWCLAKLSETLPEGTYRVEGVAPVSVRSLSEERYAARSPHFADK
jgi:leucyl aminopeptidase